MKERDIIAALSGLLVRSPCQRNDLYETDAEILELDGSLWAITIDGYSGEDRIPAGDPAAFGWNLAVATLSDLLAVGAQPRFMLDSVVTAPWMDANYLRYFSAGIQQALTACGAHMLGGDVGTGADWQFTGVALGDFAAGHAPLRRRIAAGLRGAVMVSGSFGDANLAAAGVAEAGGATAPKFELRLAESAVLRSIVPPPACIDTSDGLVSALESLCALDPDLRIEVDLSRAPCAPGVSSAAGLMGVPPEVFLMGSAGEYELLALVPQAGIETVERAGMRLIGRFHASKDAGGIAGLHFVRGAGGTIAHSGLPDPRDCSTLEDYRSAIVRMACALFETPLNPPPGEV